MINNEYNHRIASHRIASHRIASALALPFESAPVFLAIALALSACTDSRTEQNRVFQQVIQTRLDQQQGRALCVRAGQAARQPGHAPPESFTIEQHQPPSLLQQDADALAEAGLLFRQEPFRPETGPRESPPHQLAPQNPVLHYSISAEGKKYMHWQPEVADWGNIYFCTGKIIVKSIISFTSPVEVKGLWRSEVKYQAAFDQIAPWAAHPAIQRNFPHFKKITAPDFSDTAWLVFSGQEWIDYQQTRAH